MTATALVFVDGFDKYGPPGNQNVSSVMAGDWSVGSAPAIVAGLSSTGYAIQTSAAALSITGSFGSLTRLSGSIRFQNNSGSNAGRISFLNGASAVFTFMFQQSTGAIELRTGTNTGTVIATAATVSLNTTHVLSFDITIGASSAYAVQLDGVSLYSGTGNTGNGQASVNTISLGNNFSNILNTWDDLAIWDPTQAAYNSSCLTSNVVVETQFPSGDNQTQFTNDGNVVWAAGTASNGVSQNVLSTVVTTSGAGILWVHKITPQVNCTLNSVSLLPRATSAGSKWKGVVYSDSAGAPGSLLSSGTEVVGATTGTTLTLPLVTPQSLTAGTSYWIGFIGDTSVNIQQVDSTTNLGQSKANTYASGAPAGPLSGMTTGRPTLLIWGNCTGATVNWSSVGNNPEINTSAAQVHSSTVNQEDLFTFPALATNPTTIYGGAVKGFLKKSDAGARTVSLNMKSGATDSTGSSAGQGLSTTGQWQGSIYDIDPGTGVAWTGTGVNSAKSGYSVAS
jgi:hypothetical protein